MSDEEATLFYDREKYGPLDPRAEFVCTGVRVTLHYAAPQGWWNRLLEWWDWRGAVLTLKVHGLVVRKVTLARLMHPDPYTSLATIEWDDVRLGQHDAFQCWLNYARSVPLSRTHGVMVTTNLDGFIVMPE